MANKNLFTSKAGPHVPATNATNESGGTAYALSAKQGLAQYAATGCLNGTYYASADDQLAKTLQFANAVEPEFLAKTAIYAREDGFMKDMPALLAAVLSKREPKLFRKIFGRIVDNGKMLRNLVQIIRSGVTGRKSLGSGPKNLIRMFLEGNSGEQLFRFSVGNDPRLADVIKMVHPKALTPERAAIFGYLAGKEPAGEGQSLVEMRKVTVAGKEVERPLYRYDSTKLPELVKAFEQYKKEKKGAPPAVPFEMLTALDLGQAEWAEIAKNASWTQTRMNLNTFARHKVYDVSGVTTIIANRLKDPDLIRKARVFPYQLLMAFTATEGNENVPKSVRNALQDALEVAVENVPAIDGRVIVCPDVSGSMASPITGHRKGSTSKVRCIDIAALISAAVLRKNQDAEVIPFESDVVTRLNLNARDSVMTNAKQLASIGGGGTNCSAPLALLNRKKAKGDLVIYVSDNQSWVETQSGRSPYSYGGGTGVMNEWSSFKARNPNAKLVMIDIQPYATAQVVDRDDILLVGGFSDQVFKLFSLFAKGGLNAEHWTGVIEAVKLDEPGPKRGHKPKAETEETPEAEAPTEG